MYWIRVLFVPITFSVRGEQVFDVLVRVMKIYHLCLWVASWIFGWCEAQLQNKKRKGGRMISKTSEKDN